MTPKHKEFATEIERLITESGVKMGTKRAKVMEAHMIAGYIYGSAAHNHDEPFLHLLLQTGRQLTTEAKYIAAAESKGESE